MLDNIIYGIINDRKKQKGERMNKCKKDYPYFDWKAFKFFWKNGR
jgi:hypothetical protein